MKKDERDLLAIYRDLDESAQGSLRDFAGFLATRGAALPPAELPEPESIPRPDRESVVKAIKRLSASYHMLDKGRMLNETSSLMAQHIMHGRDAVEVIDELEIVFRRHYEVLRGKG